MSLKRTFGPPVPVRTLKYVTKCRSLLHRTVEHANIKVLIAVLGADEVDLEELDEDGRTPLHLAACLSPKVLNGSTIVELLVQYGSNVNAVDNAGRTALYLAAFKNNVKAVRLLLTEGRADAQICTFDKKWTPLHVAAHHGHLTTADILISNGAALRPRSKDNLMPRCIAELAGHQTVVELFDDRNERPLSMRLSSSMWFNPNLDNKLTTKAFIEKNHLHHVDGNFLVRRTSRNPKWYVLVLTMDRLVHSYVIQSDDRFYFINNEPYFQSLEELVNFYRKGNCTNLAGRLLTPIAPLL